MILSIIPKYYRPQFHVALGALHNSGERFDPPKCHPNTRTSILQNIMEWIKFLENLNKSLSCGYMVPVEPESQRSHKPSQRCVKRKEFYLGHSFSLELPQAEVKEIASSQFLRIKWP